jgi:hypothetical protein
MEVLLPLDAVYPSRAAASSAVFIAIAECYGKNIKQYRNQCGSQKITFICPSANDHFDNTTKNVTEVADDDSGFHCHQYAGEGKVAYNTRREYENVIHSADSGTICSFYAVARMTPKEKTWRFQIFQDSGLNYKPHSEECTCLAILKGKALRSKMKNVISGNHQLSGKELLNAMTGGTTNVSLPMLPSKSAMYRAKLSVKHDADGLYTENWAKLEPYLEQLAHLNPSMRVVLEKDDDNRFLRYFIGFGTSIEILTNFGLGLQAIDACHTRHHIFNGAVILLLVGRTGMNRNLPIAISLSLSETSDAYAFMAKNLMQMTGGNELPVLAGPGAFGSMDANCSFDNWDGPYARLVNPAPSSLNLGMVIIKDGFKGCNTFTKLITSPPTPGVPENEQRKDPHDALCVRHLASSARLAHNEEVKKTKNKTFGESQTVTTTFHNNAVFKIARASSEKKQKQAFNQLAIHYPFVAAYLKSRDPLLWLHYDMGVDKGLSLHGHVTSNIVEGENGCIVNEREMHPLIFTEAYLMRVLGKWTDQRTEIEEIADAGSDLTPYAKKHFVEETNLSRQNSGYICCGNGRSSRYQVWDRQSIDQERHCVDLDPKCPSCSPCNTWNDKRLPCRHMLIAIGKHRLHYLNDPKMRSFFLRTFFHPAYLIENATKMYANNSLSTEIHFPPLVLGEPVEDISIPCGVFADGCFKADENEIVQKMLPPLKYTMEHYKNNKKRDVLGLKGSG